MHGSLRQVQVRVHTDEDLYVGSLRLADGRSALSDLVGDDRVYLTLWEAIRDGVPISNLSGPDLAARPCRAASAAQQCIGTDYRHGRSRCRRRGPSMDGVFSLE